VSLIHKTLLQHRPIPYIRPTAAGAATAANNLYQITRSPLKWQQSFVLLPAAPDLISSVYLN
jgi:hypothetical protein